MTACLQPSLQPAVLHDKDAYPLGTSPVPTVPPPTHATEALWVVEPRGPGYADSKLGRRFIITEQTPNTNTVAQATFATTTPTYLLRQSGSSKRVIVRHFTLTMIAPPGTSFGKVIVAVDTVDRYSAGGTAVTPQSPNVELSPSSGITGFFKNPTATAPGGTVRYIGNGALCGSQGNMASYIYADSIIIGATGSLLVYVFDAAGAAAPEIVYAFDTAEEDL